MHEGPPPWPPLRVLIVAHNLPASVRHIGPVVRELLDRGHEVHMALEPPAGKHADDPWLRSISEHERFSWGTVESWRRDPWFPVARWLRRTNDYIRYLQLGSDRVPYFVERAAGRTPPRARILVHLPGISTPRGRRVLSRVLEAFDEAVPVSRGTVEFFLEQRADVLVLVPVLMPGATDSAYLRAAAAGGIASIMCVPSWDNLSSKQLVRVVPDALAVWNDTQKREAQELHRVPPERVVVTGAQTFDHWFGWRPRERTAFADRVGLDPDRPYLLYAGGALFPGPLDEAEFGRRWVESLRSAADPRLRDVGILIRPHPKRLMNWSRVVFEDFENVVMWPRPEAVSLGRDAEADYYDSIFHSVGVVGVNTSAMIEAAIVGRPVFTVLVPEFHASQGGTFHFDYVLEECGGFVRAAHSLEGHFAQLSALLSGESDGGLDAGRRFVEGFVRPLGLDRAATPVFADAIERVAHAGSTVRPVNRPWTPVARAALLPWWLRLQMLRIVRKLTLELGRRRSSA